VRTELLPLPHMPPLDTNETLQVPSKSAAWAGPVRAARERANAAKVRFKVVEVNMALSCVSGLRCLDQP
jgi:hypothetical protein